MRIPKKEHIRKILLPESSANTGQRKGISWPAVRAIRHGSTENKRVVQLRLNEIVVENKDHSKKSKKSSQTNDPFTSVNKKIQDYNSEYDTTDYETKIKQLHEIENELRLQNDLKVSRYKTDALQDVFREKKSLVNYKTQKSKEFEILDGPKAGFEIEWTNMVWIDIDVAESDDNLKTFVRYLKNKDVVNARGVDNYLSVKTAPYKKREVLFSSPYGTWEGQADSTVENKPNLELVTKPLTPEQWKSKDVKKDFEKLREFNEQLQAPGRYYGLFSPRELLPEIKMSVPGAYLYQAGPKHFVQMTSAIFLNNQDDKPGWWLNGLNWNAFPELKKLIVGLNTPLMYSNPKDNFPLLLKSPILNILGLPQPGQTSNYAAWIAEVANNCGITDKLQENVAKELIEKTSGHMKLKPADFTWQNYLMALLQGEDKIRTWASTAFSGENSEVEKNDLGEDIGYGQIDDRTLDENWGVFENREFSNRTIPELLKAGKEWAKETKKRLTKLNKKMQLIKSISSLTGWDPDKLMETDHRTPEAIKRLKIIYEMVVSAKECGYPLTANILSFDIEKLKSYRLMVSSISGIVKIFPFYTLNVLNRVEGDYITIAGKLSLILKILEICKEKKHIVYNEWVYLADLEEIDQYYHYVKSA